MPGGSLEIGAKTAATYAGVYHFPPGHSIPSNFDGTSRRPRSTQDGSGCAGVVRTERRLGWVTARDRDTDRKKRPPPQPCRNKQEIVPKTHPSLRKSLEPERALKSLAAVCQRPSATARRQERIEFGPEGVDVSGAFGEAGLHGWLCGVGPHTRLRAAAGREDMLECSRGTAVGYP